MVADLSVGTVATGAPGTPAVASLTPVGDDAYTLDLTIPQGADGDPAPLPAFTATATTGAPGTNAAASVSGTYPNLSLDLTIPEGEQGNPGPPNSLAIGTVTTGAPGSAAAASVTGTAPSQTLNLTIPTGATGAVSAWEYYAAGRPDVVGTLDAAALAWRNAAPSGSTFYSTDGPQGAWVWRKRHATWVCVEGDTGWVTSNSLDTAIRGAWPEATGVSRVGHLRRRPGMVDCYLGSGGGGVLSTRRDFSGGAGTVPSWARPDTSWTIAATPETPNIVRIGLRIDGSFSIIGNWVGYTHTGISWPVASTLDWPTTLA